MSWGSRPYLPNPNRTLWFCTNVEVGLLKSGRKQVAPVFWKTWVMIQHATLVLHFALFLAKPLQHADKVGLVSKKENTVLLQLLGKDLDTNGDNIASRYTEHTAKRSPCLRTSAASLRNLLKYLCTFLFLTEAKEFTITQTTLLSRRG